MRKYPSDRPALCAPQQFAKRIESNQPIDEGSLHRAFRGSPDCNCKGSIRENTQICQIPLGGFHIERTFPDPGTVRAKTDASGHLRRRGESPGLRIIRLQIYRQTPSVRKFFQQRIHHLPGQLDPDAGKPFQMEVFHGLVGNRCLDRQPILRSRRRCDARCHKRVFRRLTATAAGSQHQTAQQG